MLKHYSFRKRRRLELYFRCISACSEEWMLNNYYVAYEFGVIDRYIRKGLIKHTLEHWGITNASELKKKIDWLLQDGVRAEYNRKHACLAALTEQGRSRFLESVKDEADFEKWGVVHKCLHQLPSGNVVAYDGAWAILLARVGLALTFLTKNEAWEIKLKAAGMLQRNYRSWNEFNVGYMCGAHFSKKKPGISASYTLLPLHNLMRHSSLLYKKALWHTDLLPDKEAG